MSAQPRIWAGELSYASGAILAGICYSVSMLNDFLNNIFLSIESWIIIYVVQAIFWYFVSSWKKEGAKYVAWSALLVTTMIFVAGFFFNEVRQFFYNLTR